MKLEEYKKKLQSQLADLSCHMKSEDVEYVRMGITAAKNSSELDGFSLGLGFHKFRVVSRKELGE